MRDLEQIQDGFVLQPLVAGADNHRVGKLLLGTREELTIGFDDGAMIAAPG